MRLTRPLLTLSLAFSLSCGQGEVGDTNNIEIRALNAALATQAPSWGAQFLDTYSVLVGSNGKPLIFFYEPDGEHLSDLGYLRWADRVLVPYIKANHLTCVGMVGDSITYRCYVVKEPDGADATWSDLLGIQAYNEGVDGDTTQDVLNRLDSIIQPDIDCYFLMIGNNDLHQGVPVPQVVANIQNIVTALRTRTGKPVVVEAVMPLLQPTDS